jgi:sodium-independent sulfate anion transporter 11
MNTELLSVIAPDIPVTIIVLILEHIAISKSFGRINNYTINPSQELVAVGRFHHSVLYCPSLMRTSGFTNLLGPFLGAYPATGSFSRTAIKSKAGVRTPLAGIFTAVIVLLALYALTAMFFYIPSAGLAAVIIHAVGDLITPPHVVYQFWETSPLEVLIFFAGVLLTVFTNIENGIYLTICASLALMLWRHLKSHGVFLGRVTVYRATPDSISSGGERCREAYLPVNHRDGSNPALKFEQPYPGVFVYRFSEGFTYLNQQHYLDALVEHVQATARPTKLDRYTKIGDRPWNDPGPRRGQPINLDDDRPILRAIVLDFSSVNHVDVTSIQGLVDVRNQLDRYAAPEVVEWHFASINSRWTKRGLTSAGFGYISTDRVRARSHWTPVYSFAAVDDVTNSPDPKVRDDLEAVPEEIERSGGGNRSQGKGLPAKLTTVHGQNRPFFHIDVLAAVEAALAGVENRLAHTSSASSDERAELDVKQG